MAWPFANSTPNKIIIKDTGDSLFKTCFPKLFVYKTHLVFFDNICLLPVVIQSYQFPLLDLQHEGKTLHRNWHLPQNHGSKSREESPGTTAAAEVWKNRNNCALQNINVGKIMYDLEEVSVHTYTINLKDIVRILKNTYTVFKKTFFSNTVCIIVGQNGN